MALGSVHTRWRVPRQMYHHLARQEYADDGSRGVEQRPAPADQRTARRRFVLFNLGQVGPNGQFVRPSGVRGDLRL